MTETIVRKKDGWIDADVPGMDVITSTRPGCPKCKYPLSGNFENQKDGTATTICEHCKEFVRFSKDWFSIYGIV